MCKQIETAGKGYLYSTSCIEYLRTGFSGLRQNRARGGRGFNCGFGLRIGGLGGLRGGAAAAAPAPPVSAGAVADVVALDAGVADALVAIFCLLQAVVLITVVCAS